MIPTHLIPPLVRSILAVLVILTFAIEPGWADTREPADAATEAEIDAEAQAGPRAHKRRQQRPVKMGTSGGNINDFDGFVCCSGTLGGLVRKGERYFVLSNNHVIAQLNSGRAGDDINQPGMIDLNCRARETDFIAQLSGFRKLKSQGNNRVDAAIGEIVEGTVDTSGAVLGIGVPGNEPINPQIGMRVQKSGRTTGVRRGIVDSVRNTIFVEFGECSEDSPTVLLRFVNQFFVRNSGSKSFSAGGDSGSVIFEDVDTCPNPVGLLFAGNSQITAGNPFVRVMKDVNRMKPKGPAEFVGCRQPAGVSLLATSGLPELDGREMRLAERIQARTEDEMFKLPGVHAMGIGRSSSRLDAPVFKIYVDPAHPGTATRVPRELGGIAVEVVETERLRAFGCARPAPAG